MSVLHAIVLGITQGVSEFLPISSSGHLRLVPWLLGWNDFRNNTDLEQTFDVALHLGTLIAVIAYFWKDLVGYLLEGVGGLRRPKEMSPKGRLAWLLVLSAIPAAIAGALFEERFADLAEHEWLIGLMLIVFGLVLLWADRQPGRRVMDEFAARDATIAGSAQILALVPGVSRSGSSISALRWLGFARDDAARLSFLMLIPITAGAIAKKGIDLIGSFPPGFAAPFAWGIVASAITGFVAVWGTIRYLRTHSFTPFVIYRVVAGTAVILLSLSSFR